MAAQPTSSVGSGCVRQFGLCVHLVADTKHREPLFRDPQVAGQVAAILRAVATECGVRLYCYCIMPEHLHVVASVDPGGKPLPQFVKLLKARVTWRLRDRLGSEVWQRSFFDRVVRRSEDLCSFCLYVLQNPQERGLVEDWREYPFSWLSPEMGTKG